MNTILKIRDQSRQKKNKETLKNKFLKYKLNILLSLNKSTLNQKTTQSKYEKKNYKFMRFFSVL
jgi:hypothetical protein